MNLHRSLGNKIARTIGFYIAVIVCLAFFLFPLWNTFVGAFSSASAVVAGKFSWFPKPFSWNYPQLMQMQVDPTVWRWFLNTILISAAVIPSTVFSAFAAYGLARFRAPGSKVVFFCILSTMMLPFTVTMIPKFIMFKTFGWIDTYWVFYSGVFGGSAGAIFLLRQFMKAIPKTIDEAAKVDGAGPFRIWWNIMLPNCIPVLIVVFITVLVGQWNDFMAPLIFLNSQEKFPISVGILTLQASAHATTQNVIMFTTLMVSIPMILLFLFCQKYFVKGVVMSGIKG